MEEVGNEGLKKHLELLGSCLHVLRGKEGAMALQSGRQVLCLYKNSMCSLRCRYVASM